MRRLPVYLVLDVSYSMMGEALEAVKVGVQSLVTALRQDPHALETVYLSVVTFGGEAKQLMPLTELPLFNAPQLEANGATPLGEALRVTADAIGTEVQRNSGGAKGDWKPMIFLMTDGLPTDDWESQLERFRALKTGVVVACAAGSGADTDVLKRITESVISLDTADSQSIGAFFKWVSASVTANSIQLEKTGERDTADKGFGGGQLPPPPPEINLVG